MESFSSRRPNRGGPHDTRRSDFVAPSIERSRVQSMYVEYDAMEQLRRDLQKGAAEVARADRNRRRRARRARARLRRHARWAARTAAVGMRMSARLAGRWTTAMLRWSRRSARFALAQLERVARWSSAALRASAARASAARVSAARVSASRPRSRVRQTPLRMTADAIPDAELPGLKALAPVKQLASYTAEHLQPADDRDAHIADLDRRQLWLRENNLGQDHPDVGLLALVVARRERERGQRLRARFLYERALTITARSLGRDHPEVTAVAAELADLAREIGDLEQAATWESWPASSNPAAHPIQS